MQKKQFSVAHGHEWFFWRFDERRLFLDYCPNGYNISLRTSALPGQIFNAMRNIGAKDWGSRDVLIDLLKAYREIFSLSRKFAESFESEIAPRMDRWDGFCSEVTKLIRKKDGDTPRWNRELEEAYTRFNAESFLGGEI
jgi:hypothetical protein